MINRAALNPPAALPVPRVSRFLYLLGAALLLLVLQIASGTGPVYALLVFALMVVSYAAVSWAGGLETLFGIAIFYLLLQHVLISQVAKVFFWEPADYTLRRPVETMGVYVIGMASLALGVRLANVFRRRNGPLFLSETRPSRLLWMSILCTMFFSLLTVATRAVGVDPETGGLIQGGVLGPLKQINVGPLAIACGTAYMILSSGGRRSFGLVNGIPILIHIAGGIIVAGREAVVNPVIVYVLTCIAFRYRFRPKHYTLLLLATYVANFIIFPYALVARRFVRKGTFEEGVSRSASMMIDVIQNPFKYREQLDETDARSSRSLHQFDYYRHSSPTLDRYTVVSWADAVVDATINRGETGWETITPGFDASLPRFMNPDKPFVETGNLLAHREPGMPIGKTDHTTGITLGFFADSFSSFGWLGISVIPCIIILCLMTVYRLIINDRIWSNVLMLSLVMQLTWSFSEGTIANMILLCLVGFVATCVSLTVLYVLVYLLDKMMNRVRHVWGARLHPRQQALQRVIATIPHAGSLLGIKQSGSPDEIRR